jgi:hypothetical protein
MMRILIQGLGEVPIPVLLSIRRFKPDVAYVLCSEYQLNYVHPPFKKKNRDLVVEEARKVRTRVIFKQCDVFDPKSIRNCLLELLRSIDIFEQEVIFNYTSGSAPVRLFLGVLGVQFAKYSGRCKVVYTIRYPEQKLEIVKNHREMLREFLPSDIDLLLDVGLRKLKKRQR